MMHTLYLEMCIRACIKHHETCVNGRSRVIIANERRRGISHTLKRRSKKDPFLPKDYLLHHCLQCERRQMRTLNNARWISVFSRRGGKWKLRPHLLLPSRYWAWPVTVSNVQQKRKRERIKRLFKLILLKPNAFVTRQTNGFHESYRYRCIYWLYLLVHFPWKCRLQRYALVAYCSSPSCLTWLGNIFRVPLLLLLVWTFFRQRPLDLSRMINAQMWDETTQTHQTVQHFRPTGRQFVYCWHQDVRDHLKTAAMNSQLIFLTVRSNEL